MPFTSWSLDDSAITIMSNWVSVSSWVCLVTVFSLKLLLPFRNVATLQQHPSRLQKPCFNLHWREAPWTLWLPWWRWLRCCDSLLVPGPSCCFWAWLTMPCLMPWLPPSLFLFSGLLCSSRGGRRCLKQQAAGGQLGSAIGSLSLTGSAHAWIMPLLLRDLASLVAAWGGRRHDSKVWGSSCFLQ